MEFCQTWADDQPTTTIKVTIASTVLKFSVETVPGAGEVPVSEYTVTEVIKTDGDPMDLIRYWINVFRTVKIWTQGKFQGEHAMDTWIEAHGQLERLFNVMGREVTALELARHPNVTLSSYDFTIPMRVNKRLVSLTVECVTNLAEEELDLTPGT